MILLITINIVENGGRYDYSSNTSSSNQPYPGWILSRGEYVDNYNGCSGDGFSVSPGSRRNTTGILFWNRSYIIPRPGGGDMCLLLMDTQGLWDNETGNRLNSCIFGLSCMLSSYLIFNKMGALTSEDMNILSNLSEFSSSLNRSNEKSFQHMDLLLRDHTDIDIYCMDMNSILAICEQYKQKVFFESDGFQKSLQIIQTCYDQFDLFCLPNPGPINAVNFSGKITDIEPCFLMALGYYIENIIRTIQPRKIDGNIIDGMTFIEYVFTSFSLSSRLSRTYGQIFLNQKVFPNSANVMDATYDAINQRQMEEVAKVTYFNITIKIMNRNIYRPWMNCFHPLPNQFLMTT